jgi:hypothetical protein
MTEINVKNAEAAASFESVSKVRGSEQSQLITAAIALKPTVQMLPPVMVFKYFAPVRTWNPWMKVLLRRNMTAVNHLDNRIAGLASVLNADALCAHHAHLCPQKMTCPTSHTSLTSGCRMQNSLYRWISLAIIFQAFAGRSYHTIREV